MQRAVKKTTTLVATAAVIGFSSLFTLGSPANAAPVGCDVGGTLLAGDICELRVTAGTISINPSAQMSQLEVLLVAGGGTGVDSSQNYGVGGGGGQVKVIGFGSDAPLTFVVGGSGQASTAAQGATLAQAAPGIGSMSGTGNAGYSPIGSIGGGGGGAGAASTTINGGAGTVVADIAPIGSLFSTDTNCYGGGGGGGSFNAVGAATCGAGVLVDGATTAIPVAPTPNSGGGGAGGGAVSDPALRLGASGLIVLRWVPLEDVTVSFVGNGHGAAVDPLTIVAGGTVTKPADPTAAGFVFNGWFSDAELTIPADFFAPVTASTTFYASWSAVTTPDVTPGTPDVTPGTPAVTPGAASGAGTLASTGVEVDPVTIPLGLAALGMGISLLAFRARRARKAN
ncbi:InlB B-repeat-containing protein [Glaciibacter psychrotolerans]|uniref:Putative repeat protein (TIGR02543 family) n=1 Tax=Glaciibacter psychrotolerans TaxID=670054 RepID=A0A7Z0EGX6_9MICO|nr:InlB B-repeat-containing protein [Leifsonia psychrotolerans]NYJ21462.1 putative repeat protein (TIGR02543 family) [Leifsonia psychrotolerans]